jgi:hypothetical protein
LRLVKKFPGHPPAGAIVPSAAPGVAASVIKQAPLVAASRQRPPTSIGGGCGGGGGGGGELATCSLGGDASCGVLVQALAAASDRSRPAAIALRLFALLPMNVIMQRLLTDQPSGCAKKHSVASCIVHMRLRNGG